MSKQRIAALFDAENIGCNTATLALRRLGELGTIQSACAIGDFATSRDWIEFGRDCGVDLVLQPNLGKGKNSADIRLAIEAMDLCHRGRVEAIALVTHDRDFAPLAFRLREAGLLVFGFGHRQPSASFASACTTFEVLALQPTAPVAPVPDMTPGELTQQDLAMLKATIRQACPTAAFDHAALIHAVKAASPQLATKLKGKFLKTLVANGLVERVGKGPAQQLRRVA